MKSRIRSALLLLPLLFLFSNCGGKLPLVGWDKNHRATAAGVQETKYSRQLAEGLLSLEQSVLPALENLDRKESHWRLTSIAVGFSVSASAGIGPFSTGIKPQIYAYFSKEEEGQRQ